MADIGITLDAEALVLWKGRDFRWIFHNQDDRGNPVDFPPGRLFLELQTGGQHNAVQEVRVSSASGGTYKLGYKGEFTDPIDFYDVTENPHSLAGDVTDALEGIPGIGQGNVVVRPARLIPVWELNVTLNQSKALTEQLVNVLNKEVNNFFNQFETLFGVDVDFVIHDNMNTTIKVTSLKSYDEVGLITFAVDVTSNAVESFFNGVSELVGVIDTVSVDFYWDRSYIVEFVGELSEQSQPALVADTTALQGQGNQDVTVTILEPGKAPLTIWDFQITGPIASIKVEDPDVALIANRTRWQLVFLPDGEEAGGDPVTWGLVARVG